MRREFDTYDARLYGPSRDELRAGGVVNPQEVYGSDFFWGKKTFCMLKQLGPIDLIAALSLAALVAATGRLWDTPLV